MNEKEKEGEDTRTFSLSTLSVEKPPLLFGISLYAEHVLLYFIFILWPFQMSCAGTAAVERENGV